MKQNIISLQIKTSNNFEQNLDNLLKKIKKIKKDSIILAPELVLNGYSYDRLEECNLISKKAVDKLLDLSDKKLIGLTLTIKEDNKFFNRFYLFYNKKIVHTQDKIKLFDLNKESSYFLKGDEKKLKIVDINNLKVGILICFELRFIDFWQKLRGCDIIFIPAMWGKPRKDNLETLSKALAIANQCFVVVSNSANDDMAKSSGIISPFGIEYRDDRKSILEKEIDLKEIKKMRKYMKVGIK